MPSCAPGISPAKSEQQLQWVAHTALLPRLQGGEAEGSWSLPGSQGRTQCGVSNAQLLSTRDSFSLPSLKCLQVCCPAQLQVPSGLEKVNLCQPTGAGADHQLQSLFHPAPQGGHQPGKVSDTGRALHLLAHPTRRDLKAQCAGRESFPFRELWEEVGLLLSAPLGPPATLPPISITLELQSLPLASGLPGDPAPHPAPACALHTLCLPLSPLGFPFPSQLTSPCPSV